MAHGFEAEPGGERPQLGDAEGGSNGDDGRDVERWLWTESRCPQLARSRAAQKGREDTRRIEPLAGRSEIAAVSRDRGGYRKAVAAALHDAVRVANHGCDGNVDRQASEQIRFIAVSSPPSRASFALPHL